MHVYVSPTVLAISKSNKLARGWEEWKRTVMNTKGTIPNATVIRLGPF